MTLSQRPFSAAAAFALLTFFATVAPGAAGQDTAARKESPAAQYYSTLPFRETPYSELRGIHPMTANDAKTRKHFRFVHDKFGRVTKVSFMQGHDVIDLNDSANYYFFASEVRIEYGADTETRTFFDKHGNRITVSGDVFQELYRLDERGYRRSLEFYGVDGKPVENSWGVARYEWTLLNDGTVIEKRYGFDGALKELRGGFPFFEVRFHYGPNGWLALMQNYGLEGELTMNDLNAAQDRLEFAANGDLHSWNVLNVEDEYSVGNGPGVARGVLERDANGYEIVERYENEKGEPIANAYGFSYTRKANDRFGNRTEASNYTLDGSKLLAIDGRGYAGYRAIFDEAGRNRIAIEFFDEKRKPTMRDGRGYYRIRSKFDENDNEVETSYEDLSGKLVNRLDGGFAKIERDYDARGRLTETRFVDKDGVLVNHARAGYAVEKQTYGEHGVVASVTRLTADGKTVE